MIVAFETEFDRLFGLVSKKESQRNGRLKKQTLKIRQKLEALRSVMKKKTKVSSPPTGASSQ